VADVVKLAKVAAGEATAANFLKALDGFRSADELASIARYFKSDPGDYGEGDIFIGVRMGQVFELAKAHIDMDLTEIETLLDHQVHEARAGAVSIMAKQAQAKKTGAERREALYQLYLRRHDRINNWDLVDLGAWHVVGDWLRDRPRDILYRLARSGSLWERRTAIYATLAFMRQDTADAFALAEILVGDREDLIHKATGGVLRWAGRHDPAGLDAFLDRHAATMPRTMLRYAIEALPADTRAMWLGRKAAT